MTVQNQLVPYRKSLPAKSERQLVRKSVSTKGQGVATKEWVRKNYGSAIQHGVHCNSITITDNDYDLNFYRLADAITKGTDRGQRIGDTIKYKGISVRHTIRNNDNDERLFYRFMVLYDKKPNEEPAIDMFEGTDNAGTPIDYSVDGNSQQMIYQINRKRYGVLFDKLHSIPPNRTDDALRHCQFIQHYIPINKTIKFTAGEGVGERCLPKMYYAFYWCTADATPLVEMTNFPLRNSVYREYYTM